MWQKGTTMSNENKVAIGQDGDRKKTVLQYNTIPQSNCQILADRLLEMIDRTFADKWESWWRIGAAYRNSGGSQERFIEWSHTEKYNVQKQVERGWNNCKLTAGIGTLAYYARLSGNPDIVNELQHQHPWRISSRHILPISTPKLVVDTVKALQMLLDPWAGLAATALKKGLLERSNPKPQGGSGAGDMLTVLGMFKPNDILTFPQDPYDIGSASRDTAVGWRERLQSGETLREFFIPNIHCGEMRAKQDGKLSWRADSCFTRRYAVIEFDSMLLDDQMRLWLSLIDSGIRPVCLIFSGGKSVHAWVPASTEAEVATFFNLFLPLGADPHTKNVGRLSRTPGAIRKDKGTVQRLLYMNFEAAK